MTQFTLVTLQLPQIAAALADRYTTAECADVRSAAQEVARRVDLAERVILLTADSAVPGLRAWIEQIAATVPTAIIRTEPGAQILAPGALDVPLPTTVDELLATIRQAPLGDVSGQRKILSDGTLEPEPEPEPEPQDARAAVDPWATIDAPDQPTHIDPWQSLTDVVPPTDPDVEAEASIPAVQGDGADVDPWADPNSDLGPLAQFVEPPPPPAAVTDVWPDAGGDLFGGPAALVHSAEIPGETVWVIAAKGGVRKTTESRDLAKRGTKAGLRTALVDGNTGQGDQRGHLRLTGANLPSVYDVAHGVPARDVILSPERVTEARGPRLEPIPFSVVLAPPMDSHDPDVATPAVYRDVIAEAARTCDLVVVDTQTIEVGEANRASLLTDLIIPSLVGGSGWVVAITDVDRAAAANLAELLDRMIHAGVPTSRIVVKTSHVPEGTEFAEAGRFAEVFGRRGTYLGHSYFSAEVKGLINAGRIASDHEAVVGPLDAALHRITGRPEFDVGATATTGRRWRLFGKRR